MAMTTDPVHMRVCAIAVNDASLSIDERIRLRAEFMGVISYEALSDWAKSKYDAARVVYLERFASQEEGLGMGMSWTSKP